MEDFRSCYRCGHVTQELLDQCPRCGQRLLTARQVRRLGWAQGVIGLILVGLTGTILLYLIPLIFPPPGAPNQRAQFTGTAAQGWLVLGLLGVLLVLGLTSMISGLGQIKTGRRNRWIRRLAFGLVVLLVACLWLLQFALGD
jgi:amino acid transporter